MRLTLPLWEHQQRAVAFARRRPRGAMLALDMGCGKSASALALACDRGARRILVLCPLSVVDVWPQQVARHVEGLRVVPAGSGSVAAKTAAIRDALELYEARREPVMVVINYESAWRAPLRDLLLTAGFDLLIMDECHRIKAPGGKASRFCMELRKRVPYRLGLTGTPAPHSPLDLYAQLRAIDPTVYGTSFARFKARYTIPGGYGGHEVVAWQNEEELRRKFLSVAIQISKEEALDLPEQIHMTRVCELGKEARRIYDELERDFYAAVESGEITVANALVKLLRLQQIASGFVTNDDGDTVEVDTAKRDLLSDVLSDLPPRRKVVVFARFRKDLDTARHVAEAQGRRYGEVSGRQKDLVEGKFPENIDLLGVQIQSGGVGVDLTAASYAVYLSLGFSLGDYWQSVSRLHRPGQTNHVTYIHLLANQTVDFAVYGALQRRDEVIQEVLYGKNKDERAQILRRPRKEAA